jgi:hypothetical protein
MTISKLVPMWLALLVAAFLVSSGSRFQVGPMQRADSVNHAKEEGRPKYLSKIDSVLVIHFHPTVQCSCCINVGGFSKKSLEEYYAKPCEDGHIIFKEYDVDEDTSTAKRYKIFWSALGFEKFSEGKNEFKEVESVWEFCEEEKKFLPNFKKELDQFMRQSTRDDPQTKTQSKESKEGK